MTSNSVNTIWHSAWNTVWATCSSICFTSGHAKQSQSTKPGAKTRRLLKEEQLKTLNHYVSLFIFKRCIRLITCQQLAFRGSFPHSCCFTASQRTGKQNGKESDSVCWDATFWVEDNWNRWCSVCFHTLVKVFSLFNGVSLRASKMLFFLSNLEVSTWNKLQHLVKPSLDVCKKNEKWVTFLSRKKKEVWERINLRVC